MKCQQSSSQRKFKPSRRTILAAAATVGLCGFAANQNIQNGVAQATRSDWRAASHKLTNQADLKVQILIYNSAPILGYGIAVEMFLAADFMHAFSVSTVGSLEENYVSILGSVRTVYSLENAPPVDVVIVPGGPFHQQVGRDLEIQAYLRNALDDGATIYSICTGALLLASAALLEQSQATTLHVATGALRQLSPSTLVEDEVLFVDYRNILACSGAGASIEATLHLIERMTFPEIAEDLRIRYLNYPCPAIN